MRASRTHSLSCCLGLAVWVAACVVAQPPSPAVHLADALQKAPMAQAWAASPGGGPVANDWIQTFGDPQLKMLVDEGLRNNLDLQAAAARVDAAAGLVVQARALLYPQLSAIAGFGAVGRSEDVVEKYGLG